MSNLLHIKDAYYFEVPKALWPSHRTKRSEFPDHYIRLDDEYQDWESGRLYEGLSKLSGLKDLPGKESLLEQYSHWRHDHANYAKPFDVFLETAPSQAWFQRQVGLGPFAKVQKGESKADYASRKVASDKLNAEWTSVKAKAEDVAAYDSEAKPWSQEKIDEYNGQLSGKVLIPQIFGGKLRNNYEPESGFCVSKFMILLLVVAAGVLLLFRSLSSRIKDGKVPKGRLWNMLEAFLLFIRDGVARPAIGHHDADRFVPLLWTIFMFVLGCNLLGMIPWVGAPTGSFSVTLGLAFVTFATVVFSGSKKFGVLGFWKNLVPHMGLPLILAIPIVPMLFLIEVLGLVIKHAVLGVRLLANMVAGHLVLLAIMGLAVAAAGSSLWPATAAISVVGSALFSLLELFVAFLQAYVFTFLSALFISAAVHHH
jgi:F-type H+-transporting ATPase subunit a